MMLDHTEWEGCWGGEVTHGAVGAGSISEEHVGEKLLAAQGRCGRSRSPEAARRVPSTVHTGSSDSCWLWGQHSPRASQRLW